VFNSYELEIAVNSIFHVASYLVSNDEFDTVLFQQKLRWQR